MKKIVPLALFCLIIGLNLSAQSIEKLDPELSDVKGLLKAAGYDLFSFDISSLSGETYNITFVTKEYVKGELVENDSPEISITNRYMLADFSADNQKKKIDEGRVYDIEKGISSVGEKISIGFIQKADSLKTMWASVENMGSIRSTLSLKPLDAPGFEGTYVYDIRPFVLDKINIGGFTPLLLVGSFWYDEKYNIVRFCGENEFTADLSSKTLKLVPHYFVIGINVQKK